MAISENNNILFSHKMDKRNQISNDSSRLALLYNYDKVISNFAEELEKQFADKVSANLAKILVMKAAETSFESIYTSITDEVAFGAKFAAKNFDSKDSLSNIESDVNYMDFKQGHQDGLAKMMHNRRALERLDVMDPTKSIFFIPSLSAKDLNIALDAWEKVDEYALIKDQTANLKDGPSPSRFVYVMKSIMYGHDGASKTKESKAHYIQRKQNIIETLRDNCRVYADNGVVYSLVQLAVIVENTLNRDDYIIDPTARSILKESELLTLSVNIESTSYATSKDVYDTSKVVDFEQSLFIGDTELDASLNNNALGEIIMLFMSWMFETKALYSSPAFKTVSIKSSTLDRFILPLSSHPLYSTISPTLKKIYKAYIPKTPNFSYINFLEEIGKKGTPGSSTHINVLESRSQTMIRRDLRDVAKIIEEWRLNRDKVSITEFIDKALEEQGTTELTLIEKTGDCEFRLRSNVDEFTKSGTIKIDANRPIRSHERLINGSSGFNDALVKRSVTQGGCAVDTIEFEKVTPFFNMFDELYLVTSDTYIRTYTVGEVIRRLNKRSSERRPYLREINAAPERLMVSDIIKETNMKSVVLDYEIASTDQRENRMVLLNNLLELKETACIYNVQKEQFKIGLVCGTNPINIDRAKHTAIHSICHRLFTTELFTTPTIAESVTFDYKESNKRYFKRMDILNTPASPYEPYQPSDTLVNLLNNKYATKIIADKFDGRDFRDLSLFKFEVHTALSFEMDQYIGKVQEYVMNALNVDSTAFKLFAKLIKGTAREADKLELDKPLNARVISLLLNLVFEPILNFAAGSSHLAMLYLDKFTSSLIAENI